MPLSERTTEAGRVLVVGESLVDIVEAPSGAVLARSPGGSPLNVAVGLARLGVATSLATCIGADELGALVRDHAAASGVTLVDGSVGAARTGTATASLDAAGSASYAFDISWDPPPLRLTPGLRALHVGSLATVLPPGAASVADLVDAAARSGIPVSYDPNVRTALAPAPPAAWDGVRRLAASATVVKLSDEDLAYLTPGADLEAAARTLLTGPATLLVVVTLGAQGGRAFSDAGSACTPARGNGVVDTVGAGDSFMAALLTAMLELGHLEPPRALVPAVLEQLLSAAGAAAALTCGRRGADLPWRAELSPGWPRT